MSQLLMYRLNLDNLPPLVLPEGFYASPFKIGEDAQWENVMNASFGGEHNFAKEISSNPVFFPERVRFIRVKSPDGRAVASATAWKWQDTYPKECGYLHMVGALPESAGHGLGYCVVLDALYEMKRQGCSSSVLSTDDFRIPAIKTYLKLGYLPVIRDNDHCERWQIIFGILGEKYKF
jgi:mycothiol synthase